MTERNPQVHDVPVLRIRLLGELDISSADRPLPPLQSPRARSLLAYLLLNRHAAQPRQRLAFLLWPDSTEPQARTNLRHLLHNLRRAVPELMPYIEQTAGTLRWRDTAPYWLDVAAFEVALARADAEPVPDPALLRAAVECYRGELLPGCYDEWITPERDRLRRAHLRALERLTRRLEELGDIAAAIHSAAALLACDPLAEATHRTLMRLHASRGDRARALRCYHECVVLLERELGVEPSTATRELYETLLPADAPADAARGATPLQPLEARLVGRAREWQRLTALWRAAERGQPQCVVVSGEAGIGKTRLVAELQAWCERRDATTLSARCYAAEGATSYAAVSAWLQAPALQSELRRRTAAEFVELTRLLPELVGGSPAAAPEPLPLADQRVRLFRAIAGTLLGHERPLLLVLDDVQWCDRESLRVIHYLLRSAGGARLLLAATVRAEEVAADHPAVELLRALRILGCVTEIELDRLDLRDTTALGRLLGGQPLDDNTAARLYRETEGNPLFITEAVRAGAADLERVPSPRVQAVIEHRLALLSPTARTLVDVAATIGREFTYDVLAAASGSEEATLVGALDELWRARILREQESNAWDFSHDRIREVAYHALSPARRTHYHHAVADALQGSGMLRGATGAAIAAHYEKAGRVTEAIAAYETAAESAQRLGAAGDAARLLCHALDMLRAQGQDVARDERELELTTALLTPLAHAEGFASARLNEAQQRALVLARRLEREPPPPLLASLAIASLARDDFDAARRYGTQLRALGRGHGEDTLLVESGYVLGIAAYWQGELRTARRHFEAVVQAPPARQRTHLLRSWLDPHVVCTSRLGNTLWFLGDVDGAVRARADALALADELGHVYSRAAARTFGALLALEMNDPAWVRDAVAVMDHDADALEGSPLRIAAELLRAWLRALAGDAAGITGIEAALHDARGADHAPGMRAVMLRVLLAAHRARGDVHGCLATADRMLAHGGATRLWEAEARRVRGECLLRLGARADAVPELERAITVARAQGARTLEHAAEVVLAEARRSGEPLPVRPR